MVETIFQIKRSPGSAAPTSLLFGEPAWVEATNTLYIGRSDNTVVGIPFGASYQPSSSRLNELAVLSPTNGAFLVGNGSSFALQSGAGARSLLGLGSAAIAASTDFVSAAEKGAAGGVATLDGTGKVPTSQLSPPNIPVLSVFGRTGSITPQAGDYTAAQVGALAIANNLSDLTSAATARANLGLGTAAIVNTDNLLNRVNHTGTQAISTIAGLETALNSKLSGSELNNHVSAPILDHPDGSVTDIKIGNRTVSDVAAPTNLGPGSLTQWFGWLVNRVKSITGKANWWETPATTLEATANHLANTSNPHNVTAAQIGAIATTEKGVANGVATLDGAGKVPTAQIPPIAINETFPVNSEAEQLALTAEVGDFAVRLDALKTFILRSPGPSTLSNWQEVLTPTSGVTSVFGRTGVVGAQPGDYTAAQVGALAIASDLSDLNSPSIARNNLGLGSLATKSSLLAADIPNLDAAKITTGVFGDSQIPASIARDSEVQSAVSAKIDATEKGAAGGVATLDGTGKVPTAQLPELGAVQSVFGRIGAVEAELGDYDTDQVVEGATNLYFTAARSRNSLSATGPLAYNAATGTFSVPNTTATWNANQLQGRAISTTAPTDLQSLRWNNSLSQWEPQTATVLSANITDSTAIGRSLLTAVDAAAARAVIGGTFTYDQSELPSSPALGETWRERSSAGLVVGEWFWNGALWLRCGMPRTESFLAVGFGNFPALAIFRPPFGYDLYLETFTIVGDVGVTNDASNFHVCNLQYLITSNNGGGASTVASLNTSGVVSDNFFRLTATLNQQILMSKLSGSTSSMDACFVGMRTTAGTVGTPSSLSHRGVIVTWREVRS